MAIIRRPIRSWPIRLFLIGMFAVPLVSLIGLLPGSRADTWLRGVLPGTGPARAVPADEPEDETGRDRVPGPGQPLGRDRGRAVLGERQLRLGVNRMRQLDEVGAETPHRVVDAIQRRG